MSLNVIDYIILAILALFVILGFRKGIISGIASIAALILGIYAAIHFSTYLAPFLTEHLHTSGRWLSVLTHIVTFILVVIIVMLVAKLIERLVDMTGLGFFNRLGGAILGLIKGLILISLVMLLINFADPHGKWLPEKPRQSSWFYGKIEKVIPKVMKFLGSEIKFPE